MELNRNGIVLVRFKHGLAISFPEPGFCFGSDARFPGIAAARSSWPLLVDGFKLGQEH